MKKKENINTCFLFVLIKDSSPPCTVMHNSELISFLCSSIGMRLPEEKILIGP